MHIGVFILLLLSGERNFGVRLNKPYTVAVPMDIPVFSGTHADLMIIVFHKIITTGHQRLQPLFDCLLTVLVNVSPYLKTLSMVASTKLLHFLEAFSTPWFLFSSPNNHHLVFFLLEIFNNIIQYQFDGNSNLVYTIIRKRHVFHALANLATDSSSINRSLLRKSPLIKKPSKGKLDLLKEEPQNQQEPRLKVNTSLEGPDRKPSTDSTVSNPDSPSMEGSHPAMPAEPGTLKVSLALMPGIEKITEKESAHPSPQQLNQLTRGSGNGMASSPPNSPTEPTTSSSSTSHLGRFKEVIGADSPADHLTNANEDETVATRTASGSTNADSLAAAASTNSSKNQCQILADANSSSGTKMTRSISMPLSKDSPGLKSARNQQNANVGLHGGSNQMQRSFSVLSSQVSNKM